MRLSGYSFDSREEQSQSSYTRGQQSQTITTYDSRDHILQQDHDDAIGDSRNNTMDNTISDTYDTYKQDYPRRNMVDDVTTIPEDDELPRRPGYSEDEEMPSEMPSGPTYSAGSETDLTMKKYQEDTYYYERNAINDAQSVAYTAFTMNLNTGQTIVEDLRNVGVTVLSLESLSTAAMIDYMDAVTTMRLGTETDEKCMLYTDRMGRVFNVVISVRYVA